MKFLGIISILSLSFNTHSAVLNCSGHVNELEILSTGIVRIKMDGSGLNNSAYICRSGTEWGGIDQTTCNAWISFVQFSLATGKKINVSYNTNDYSACSELPYNSNSLTPFLVSVKQN